MNTFFNLFVWLVSRTTWGRYAVMSGNVMPAIVLLVLFGLAITVGLGWLLLTFLSLKGLIGFVVGCLVTFGLMSLTRT